MLKKKKNMRDMINEGVKKVREMSGEMDRKIEEIEKLIKKMVLKEKLKGKRKENELSMEEKWKWKERRRIYGGKKMIGEKLRWRKKNGFKEGFKVEE